jgi:hypothetical protein
MRNPAPHFGKLNDQRSLLAGAACAAGPVPPMLSASKEERRDKAFVQDYTKYVGLKLNRNLQVASSQARLMHTSGPVQPKKRIQKSLYFCASEIVRCVNPNLSAT